MQFQKITLIGVGLLGGSIGLAVRQGRLAARMEGYVRRAASVEECLAHGVVDAATEDLLAAVRGADLVILCTPLAQMRGLVEKFLPALAPGAIVTDVGSVKGQLVQELEPLFAGTPAHFVGSHPMAGGEKMGVSAARADLLQGAVCVVTPTAATDAVAAQKVTDFWRALGMKILTLPPDLHDALVSRSSHLPHVVAASLATLVLDPSAPAEQAALCAGGFRDTTRIASGSPEMWRDIALANRTHLDEALGSLIATLETFRQTLSRADEATLTKFFTHAKQRRDGWCHPKTSRSPE